MSWQAMQWVMDHSTERGTRRLVLLSIARHADPDGTNAWPSIETIMAEAQVSESAVHRAIRGLIEAGSLRRWVKAGGPADLPADRRPNLYAVVMKSGERGATSDTSRGAASDTSVGERGAAGDTPEVPPVTRREVPPAAPNQSSERSKESPSSVGGDREREPASSSDDDDGISRELVDAVVELKMADARPDNPGPYRAAVARSVVPEHGDALRQVAVEHPDWRPTWIARAALGLPLADPSPSEVFRECPDCTNGIVETSAGAARCPTCAWARAS